MGCRSAALSERGDRGPRRHAGSSPDLRDVLFIRCGLGDGPCFNRRSPHERLVHATIGPETLPRRSHGQTAARLIGNRVALPRGRRKRGDSRVGTHAVGSPVSATIIATSTDNKLQREVVTWPPLTLCTAGRLADAHADERDIGHASLDRG